MKLPGSADGWQRSPRSVPFAMGHSLHLPVLPVTLTSNRIDRNVDETHRKPCPENRAVRVSARVNSGHALDGVGHYLREGR